MAMTTKKEKKQSKGVAGSGLTSKELKELKFNERIEKMLRSGIPASRLQDEFDMDDMSMPILNLSKEQLLKIAKDSLLAKGGEVKKYKKGGSVKKKKSKKAGRLAKRGYGAAKK